MDNDIAQEEDTDKAIESKPKPQVNKDSVPSSLLARVKELPSKEELGVGE